MPYKKRSTARRRKPSTRYSKKKRTYKRHLKDVIHYNPKNTNAILPREYFTTLTTKVSGTLAIAAFSASGQFNSADMNLDATNVVTPFRDFPGAATIVWLDGVSPLTLPATAAEQLFGPAAYVKLLVYKTQVTWRIAPSVTSQNDSMMITLVPTLNNTNPPGSAHAAYKQPFMKFANFRSVGNSEVLKMTVSWPQIIGISMKDYLDDIEDLYANTVTTAGVYAVPSRPCFINTVIQSLDNTAPSNVVPFTYTIKHWIKMSEYIYSLQP